MESKCVRGRGDVRTHLRPNNEDVFALDGNVAVGELLPDLGSGSVTISGRRDPYPDTEAQELHVDPAPMDHMARAGRAAKVETGDRDPRAIGEVGVQK